MSGQQYEEAYDLAQGIMEGQPGELIHSRPLSLDIPPMPEEIAKVWPAMWGDLTQITKDTQGSDGRHSYNYSSLASVIALLREVLPKHGLGVAQPPAGLHGDQVVVDTIVIHSSGSQWHIKARLKQDPSHSNICKAAGSSISYLRRYTLQGVFAIAAEDDDGTASEPERRSQASRQQRTPAKRSGTAKQPRKSAQSKAGDMTAQTLIDRIRKAKDSMDMEEWSNILSAHQVEDLDKVDLAQASAVFADIKKAYRDAHPEEEKSA